MESPRKAAGWTGEGSHITGKRKTRLADGAEIIPTPPRTRMTSQLPTPETGRRTSKRVTKSQADSRPTTTSLPTPETLPRKRKTPPSHSSHDTDQAGMSQSDPSPTGHTTFCFSQSHSEASSSRADTMHRRRPGLTFAQQMAAAANAPATSNRGVGVGMRGMKSGGGHQVDKIVVSRPLATLDDNPFIIPGSIAATAMGSPGRSTRHRPILGELADEFDASPRTRSRSAKLRSPPLIDADPIHSTVPLLSPPRTTRSTRIRTTPTPPSPAAIERAAKAERLQKMRDEDDNPFLIKPGQRAVHRPRLIVDESKPIVNYVFRGAKKLFANPWPSSDYPAPGSDLPVEHEDFEPHPCPKPRLLWPSAPESLETPRRGRRAVPQSTGHSRAMSDDGISPPSSPLPMVTPGGPQDMGRFVSDDEFLPEDEEDIGVRRGLLFGPKASIQPRSSVGTRRTGRA